MPSLWSPSAAARQRLALAPQSLLPPACHLRRCRPNHETMIAASRNGTIAVEIAAPSPMRPPRIAVL